MKGHIHRRELINVKGKKSVRWYAVIDLPRGPNGKRRQKWHGGFPTRREADLARADVVNRLKHGTYVEHTSLTLEQWVTGTWLTLIEPQLKPSTFHSYKRNMEIHVLPHLGHVRLMNLTPHLLTSAYAEIMATGRKRGNGSSLSITTVQYLHTTLHRALVDAVTSGLLESNPASRAKVPRYSGILPKEQRCWSAEELAHFLEVTDPHPLSLAWRLAAMTGMRRGEVLGLRWKDVDVTRQQLTVAHTLVSAGGVVAESTPKNGKTRVVDLDDGTAALLSGRSLRNSDPDARVVLGTDHQSPKPDSLSRAFRTAISSTDLDPIRFHDLRHTHATLSLAAGVPIRVVAERLGHSSPAFTLRRYAHVLPGMQAQAAEQFAALLRSGEKPHLLRPSQFSSNPGR